MELFKTSGVLDEQILKEFARHGITPSEKIAVPVYFVCSVLFFILEIYSMATLFFILAFLLPGRLSCLRKLRFTIICRICRR